MTAPVTCPAFKPILFSFQDMFFVFGWVGGEKNVIFIQVLHPCPKHWYLKRCCLFVQHTAQGCGARHVVTSIHARNCSDHAQNVGLYRAFACLYDILCKDVEQNTLSQASMPVATMPKPFVFTAFLFFSTTCCARMWNKTRCHKHPCLWRPCEHVCIYCLLAVLYNILCKDLEKDMLSQASLQEE